MTATFGPYPAKCVAIHDGDTLTFDIDLGFDHLIAGQDWNGSTRLSCETTVTRSPGFDGTITLANGSDVAQLMLAAGQAVPLPAGG